VRDGPRGRVRAIGRTSLVLLCSLALVVPMAGAVAQSRSSEEIQRELHETEREAEGVESELDAVRARLEAAEQELAEIGLRLEEARGQLAAAEGQVALAENALVEAEDVAALARVSHDSAVELLESTEARLTEAERKLATQLVESFKYGSSGAQHGAMALEVLRRAEDPNSFAVGMKQLQMVIDDQDTTVRQVFQLRDERSELADDAARARGRATQAAADAEATLRLLEDLRAQAAALAEEIAADEARQRQIVADLEQTEAETAAMLRRVSERESALRADFRKARDREAAERAAAEAARRAAAGGGGSGAGGGPSIDGMVCPVQGAVAGRDFINDWGFPRSGGRRHQGNDIFANRGRPVVAVHDATVVSWNPPNSQTALGGITVTYETADGSHWYNAHLDTIASGISPGVSVSRGQVIGTVGNTGNARTTPPHLHIGRRYGGSPVNPWPTISQVCR
jgi:murein DD-endopeptidase MepM/ murein hydrolase activator NlpD